MNCTVSGTSGTETFLHAACRELSESHFVRNSLTLYARDGCKFGAAPASAAAPHFLRIINVTDSTAGAAPAKAALWEDFVDIFYQPSDVFERRRDGKFGLALLFLVVASGILFVLFRNGLGPIFDAEIARNNAAMLAANPSVNAEQLAQGAAMMEKFAAVGYVIFMPIAVVLTGIVLWIVGKLFDAKQSIPVAIMVATYAQFPRLIELCVNAVQGMLLSPESITSRFSVSLGVARFVDATTINPVLLAFIGSLDLFTLWVTALIGIGLYVTAGVKKESAAIVAALIWVVGLVPGLIGALRQG